MSRIPHKKSRPITVNNATYRWMLKGKSRYVGNTAEVMELTVQRDEEKPGGVFQVLLVSKWLDDNEQDDNNWVHKASIYPSDVNKCITYALGLGWDPTSNGVFTIDKKIELHEFWAEPIK